MSEYIIYIFVAIVGFVVGYIYREGLFIRDAIKVAENFRKVSFEEAASHVNSLKHEIINSIHYFYRHSDNTFVCQGETLDQAATAFCKTLGSDQYAIFQSIEDQKFYMFTNNKCLEYSDNVLKQHA